MFGILVRSVRSRAALQRGVALGLLLLIAFFSTSLAQDPCTKASHEHRSRTPHLVCVEDGAPAAIPTMPAEPSLEPPPPERYESPSEPSHRDHTLEPETPPPRTRT